MILLGLFIGVAFGFIIHRVGASQYENIVNTLRLKDLKVLKFMVLAISIGMVGVYALNVFGLANFSIKPAYVLGVALGGLIFGVGFAVSGYCPGTAVCALGEGKRDALYTIIGGLVGAFVYSLVYGGVKTTLIAPMDLGKVTLASVLPLPELATAIIVGVALAVVAFALPTAKQQS